MGKGMDMGEGLLCTQDINKNYLFRIKCVVSGSGR